MILRRYTNLAATIHILRKRVITLLNTESWDDRNDAYFMSQYKIRRPAQSVLALCFAKATETYHHWKVFSPGSDGVCIEFDREALLSAFDGVPNIEKDKVEYKLIEDITDSPPELEELPFVKRLPYRDEKEYRIVYVDCEESIEFKDFRIPLKCIRRITLSPWLPKPLSAPVGATLRSIKGCSNLSVARSTLIENERWKDAARNLQL